MWWHRTRTNPSPNNRLEADARPASAAQPERYGILLPEQSLPLENSRTLAYLLPMSKSVEQLAEQAMTLPTESRARLADLLVESLDADELGPIDRLWTAEAKRRRDEVRAGHVKTIPGEKALRKVRDAVKR